MPTKIEVSHRTIIFILILMGAMWLIFQIRDILVLLFIAFILTSATNPLVDRLESWRLPRSLAILAVYLIGFLLIGMVSSTIFRPLISQSISLANQLPILVSNAWSFTSLGTIHPENLTSQLGSVGEGLFRFTIGLFSNVITIVTTLVFTFYFLLERKHLEHYLGHFAGEEISKRMIIVVRKIEDRLGAWVRGELMLMLIVGLASYIGLTIFQIEYALPLAIIAGIMEIVPVVGPIVSAIPAIIVALSMSSSPLLALMVVGLYFVIQQLENNLIVPTVMRKAVDLPPLVTLLALIIGGKLGGAGGAILAVPFVVTLRVVLTEIFDTKFS